ncbi:E3 ubiquitin-protein ligase TRIM11-like [Hyperolius riggenbachi]|uniref:E3 ubiquitin-protein ligase TRIM11-like n=1 Tax=Hyperolius riggenbachi TaxID=752182 RepID=UPI0035A3592F
MSDRLREELLCPICMSIYTEPVMLRCGHNFCRACVTRVLDTQQRSRGYSCPQCREGFEERPELQKNRTVGNIVNVLSYQPQPSECGTMCTYCIFSPVPAAKMCLLCDAFLCHNHLRAHKKSPEHIITDSTLPTERGICSEHREPLKYFCTEDTTCICQSCFLVGDHKGHAVELLDEVVKNRLRGVGRRVATIFENTELTFQNLAERKMKALEIADGQTERVHALFGDLRTRLEDLEKSIESELARRVSVSYDDVLRRVGQKKDMLAAAMRRFGDLCDVADPLSALHASGAGGACGDTEGYDEETESRDNLRINGGDVYFTHISHIVHAGLTDVVRQVNSYFYLMDPITLTLDVNTASPDLCISPDRKTASWSPQVSYRAQAAERSRGPAQVSASRLLTSGQCHWDMDVRGSDSWSVGFCPYNRNRNPCRQPKTGMDASSWALYWYDDHYTAAHESRAIPIPDITPSGRVRIYIDYDAGQISFYDLCDDGHVKHLHTFSTRFTDILQPVFGVFQGCIKILG